MGGTCLLTTSFCFVFYLLSSLPYASAAYLPWELNICPLGFLISSEQEINKIFINMGDGKQSLLGSQILPEHPILVDCGQSSILESFPVGMGME